MICSTLRDILPLAEPRGHMGHRREAHVLQQPQLIVALHQDLAALIALIEVLIEQCGALEAQRQGSIRIRRHCNIIEGHILPDRPKKRRGK